MKPEDRLIACSSCKVVFLFGGGEREYFEEQELEEPKRCGPCRRARREGRQFARETVSEEGTDREVGDGTNGR